MTIDPGPLGLSAILALSTTAILLVLCLPLARWRLSWTGKAGAALDSFFMLAMVLPPTVVGFYFLRILSPAAPLGAALRKAFGLRLLFTFPGLLLASCVACLPFMYQTLKAAMLSVDPRLVESSYTLGKGRAETFVRIVLPEMAPGIGAASILTFAHAVGEFGIALMVGGSVPGSTRTASIALYEYVEASRYREADAYALAILAFGWICMIALGLLSPGARRRMP
jgi:molybdate transport system permease protein